MIGSLRRIDNFTPQPIQFLSLVLGPILNDPNAIIFAFATLMIATGLNVVESLLLMSVMVNYYRCFGDSVSSSSPHIGDPFIKTFFFP